MTKPAPKKKTKAASKKSRATNKTKTSGKQGEARQTGAREGLEDREYRRSNVDFRMVDSEPSNPTKADLQAFTRVRGQLILGFLRFSEIEAKGESIMSPRLQTASEGNYAYTTAWALHDIGDTQLFLNRMDVEIEAKPDDYPETEFRVKLLVYAAFVVPEKVVLDDVRDEVWDALSFVHFARLAWPHVLQKSSSTFLDLGIEGVRLPVLP